MNDQSSGVGRTGRIDLAREPEFALGALQVRPASRDVTINGRTEVLQPRVMQVLVALARVQGEVVSRDDLISSCWDGLSVGEDAINRCISNVRRLAKLDGQELFRIETVPRVGYRLTTPELPAAALAAPATRKVAVAVLPFVNMSSDPEQDYFSDGITEDIITDLSKVSALTVVSRSASFGFRGKQVADIAARLKVSHVLEGSVRKFGNHVRISVELIDCSTGGQQWAERYDRDLSNIFALQDEISQAIVSALKIKLLPEEKRAIERHRASNPEAYKIFLMARQFAMLGNERHQPVILRLAQKSIDIDPSYAPAWALLSIAQSALCQEGGSNEDGRSAAQRAIDIDAEVPDGHIAMAHVHYRTGAFEESDAASRRALALDPDSYEGHRLAGCSCLAFRRFEDAIVHFERAANLVEGECHAAGMVVQAYDAIGDREGARQAARRLMARVEKVIVLEPDHTRALGFGACALAILGETERAKDWTERAVLLDPDNGHLRYNLACSMAQIGEDEIALDLLEKVTPNMSRGSLMWMERDTDLRNLKKNPRFKALLAQAKARFEENAKRGARAT